MESDLGRLAAERDDLRQRVAKLALEYPLRQKSKVLEQQIADLKIEIERQRRIKQVLAAEIGITAGFGDYLEALARRHVHGTWLRSVTIDGGGARIGITGSATAPALVTTYIQRLADEPVFAGATFNIFDLQLSDRDEHQSVDFVLRTSDGVNP